jgi:hypothetical protein
VVQSMWLHSCTAAGPAVAPLGRTHVSVSLSVRTQQYMHLQYKHLHYMHLQYRHLICS